MFARTSLIATTLFVTVFLSITMARADLIPVKTSDKNLSPDQTMTFYFQSAEPIATLVYVPGGEGRVGRGLRPEHNKPTHGIFSRPHYKMLKNLSDPQSTSGRFNVVLFDNPYEMYTSNVWSSERMGGDHLSRLEDVIRFYREKIW